MKTEENTADFWNKPPFRADHVGSFLRPESIKKARKQLQDKEITPDDLRRVEDEAIRQLVEKQKQSGLKAVTDGEFRRSWWHLDFFAGLEGIQKTTTSRGFIFHGVHTKAESVELAGPVGFSSHPMLRDFAFLKSCAGNATVKMTIPSPAMLHFVLAIRNEQFTLPNFYGSESALLDGIANAYKDALKAFYDAGCRYLQLDDTSWGALCSAEQPEALIKRGIDPAALAAKYVDLVNAAISDRPSDMTVTMHICRGNFRSTWFSSGGYEPVAQELFGRARLDGFFLEYDSERAGDFTPLRHMRDQQVVLGLVSSKTGTLEDRGAIRARIDEAAQTVPLEQLCLSPQCGFSSTEEGNTLTEEEQWNKIRLVVEVAESVWK